MQDLSIRSSDDNSRSVPETTEPERLPLIDRYAGRIREYFGCAAAHEYARCLGILGDNPLDAALKILHQRLASVPNEQFFSSKELAGLVAELAAHDGIEEQDRAGLEKSISEYTLQCCALCLRYLENSTSTDTLDELTTFLLPHLQGRDLRWPPELQSLSQKWGEWSPGFAYDEWSVGQLKKTLPGVPENAIPAIVKRYEDPSSPHALVGAVTLAQHDIIHILLGRGLLDQDEAFVLGFTMGTASREDRESDLRRMRDVLGNEYQEPFRIPRMKLQAFDLGVECARRSSCRDIFLKPLTDSSALEKTVAQLRQEYGIDKQALLDFYAREREQIPGTFESLRLA